jgi:hypothetical protein
LLRNIRQIYVTLQLSQIHQITQVFYKSEKKSKKKSMAFLLLVHLGSCAAKGGDIPSFSYAAARTLLLASHWRIRRTDCLSPGDCSTSSVVCLPDPAPAS